MRGQLEGEWHQLCQLLWLCCHAALGAQAWRCLRAQKDTHLVQSRTVLELYSNHVHEVAVGYDSGLRRLRRNKLDHGYYRLPLFARTGSKEE